jgi:hypothetical protein
MKDFILQQYRISFSNNKSLLYFTAKNPKNIKVGQNTETNTHFYLHEMSIRASSNQPKMNNWTFHLTAKNKIIYR